MTSSKWKHFPRNWLFVWGFPAQRPVTQSCDVFCNLRLNKRWSKQSWGWWFETLSRPFWHHCNVCSGSKVYSILDDGSIWPLILNTNFSTWPGVLFLSTQDIMKSRLESWPSSETHPRTVLWYRPEVTPWVPLCGQSSCMVWSSWQIRKITGSACAGNAGKVFPAISG